MCVIYLYDIKNIIMGGNTMRKTISIIALCGLFIGTVAPLNLGFTQVVTTEEVEERTAEITSLNGTASIKSSGKDTWVPASVGDVLKAGDTFRTDPMASAELNFDGSSETAIVKVSENAELVLNKLTLNKATNAKDTLIDLAIGSVLIKANELEEESKFEVNTPTSIVGVRGTTFEVRVSATE